MNDVETRPVVGWTFHLVAETAIVMDLHTVTSDAQMRAVMAGSAAPDNLPALLTPAQALELAEVLRQAAGRVLAQQTPDRSRQS